MTTLVCIHHAQVGNRHFQFGDELPPDLIPREVIAEWLDQRWLAECDSADRRSLYRLLHRFSGAKEKEQLTKQERNEICLSE
jgi:hypothetical protein